MVVQTWVQMGGKSMQKGAKGSPMGAKGSPMGAKGVLLTVSLHYRNGTFALKGFYLIKLMLIRVYKILSQNVCTTFAPIGLHRIKLMFMRVYRVWRVFFGVKEYFDEYKRAYSDDL